MDKIKRTSVSRCGTKTSLDSQGTGHSETVDFYHSKRGEVRHKQMPKKLMTGSLAIPTTAIDFCPSLIKQNLLFLYVNQAKHYIANCRNKNKNSSRYKKASVRESVKRTTSK